MMSGIISMNLLPLQTRRKRVGGQQSNRECGRCDWLEDCISHDQCPRDELISPRQHGVGNDGIKDNEIKERKVRPRWNDPEGLTIGANEELDPSGRLCHRPCHHGHNDGGYIVGPCCHKERRISLQSRFGENDV